MFMKYLEGWRNKAWLELLRRFLEPHTPVATTSSSKRKTGHWEAIRDILSSRAHCRNCDSGIGNPVLETTAIVMTAQTLDIVQLSPPLQIPFNTSPSSHNPHTQRILDHDISTTLFTSRKQPQTTGMWAVPQQLLNVALNAYNYQNLMFIQNPNCKSFRNLTFNF